jgi:hypothetical protein
MNVSLTPVVNSKGHATSRHVQRGLIMNFCPTLHEISYETRKAVEIRLLCLFPIESAYIARKSHSAYFKKEATLQRTCLFHTKILSPVKIYNPVCLSFIMIAEKNTAFISV